MTPLVPPPEAGRVAMAPRVAAPPSPQAQAFEAVFAGQMAQLMLDSVPDGSDAGFGAGSGGAMVRGLLAERIGDAMAARGALGIAPLIDRVLAALSAPAPQEPQEPQP